ncbi:MAG TPA: hypothetical protein VJ749_18915 [Pyrinomonadaceae bacterium]|nr:hypothetical protein [Pyrinomonadaceae bacterium]
MTKFLVVCLLLVGAAFPLAPVRAQRKAEESSPFVLAERFGEASAKEQTFFLFSTSVAKYILRHDGTGEVTRAGVRRSIYLKVGAGERIERVYSLEYEGDLLLLYQAGDSGYLARMNQSSRKVRTVTIAADFTPPTIKDHRLVFSDGAVVSLN